jgi:hypothetical protein
MSLLIRVVMLYYFDALVNLVMSFPLCSVLQGFKLFRVETFGVLRVLPRAGSYMVCINLAPFSLCSILNRRPDSSVGIATGYGLDGPGIESGLRPRGN